jgi:XTP/dITP diphosphohydrolase
LSQVDKATNQRQTLLLATNNPGKLREFGELLADLPLRLVTPADLGLHLEVDEAGLTYADNARLKALAFARASNLPSVADDSGLEIPALGGWPGVHSVRFAGPGATDADRRRIVLDRLAAAQGDNRRARFVCVVVLATPTRVLGESEGELTGTIAPAERGEHGFGYDSIFIPERATLSLAEVPADEKNRISHRARAIAGLRASLSGLPPGR